MKLFRFDPEVGRSIDHFQRSGFTISRVAHLLEEAVISCAYLSANGLIGDHQATLSQWFLVVGKGWVRGESSDKISIEAGRAAYWEKGNGTSRGERQVCQPSSKIRILTRQG